MPYTFGVLRLGDSPEAKEHNKHLLGQRTLGIEVTSASLAKQCGLGNVDPQHGPAGYSSAIEQALEWPLPPNGSTLVTIRLDKDSIGAMAVFLLRSEGMENDIDKLLVSLVGAMDRMGLGNVLKHHPELVTDIETTDALQVIALGICPMMADISARVRETARILTGVMSKADVREIALLKTKRAGDFTVEHHGGVALIVAPGRYGSARDWGNRNFPVVLVCDPEYRYASGVTGKRWSIVRQPTVFDRVRFEELVNEAEASARGLTLEALKDRDLAWGGNRNIVSSAQGNDNGTALSDEEIIAIAWACAESGIFS